MYMINNKKPFTCFLPASRKGRPVTGRAVWFTIGCSLLLLLTAHSENGWDFIKSNDNKTARKVFTDMLGKDSLNQDALKGLLYLSDIEQDKLAYPKYANALIRH